MKKIKQRIAILLAFAVIVTMLAACTKSREVTEQGSSSGQPASTEQSSAASEQAKYPMSFKDSLGTEFTLEQPLEKIVVLNRQTAEVIKILGAEGKVVATGDTTIKNNPYLGFNDLPDMGATDELNIEAIIGLKPDAVLVHTNRATEVLEEKLNPLGIKVIRIDNYQPERYEEEMRTLARILEKEDRAEEFLAYRADMEKMSAEKVKDIPEAERKRVMALSVGFINSNGGYRVFPSMSNNGEIGVGEGYATILAGGVDATPDIKWDPSMGGTTIEVEKEFAVKSDPDVITLHGTWLGGYDSTDKKEFQDVLDNIYKISSIGQMKAGKDKNVYIFHTDMLGAAMRHIGVLQLGKYLYPDRFQDVDVEAYAKEYFEKWIGAPYRGIWFYSAGEQG